MYVPMNAESAVVKTLHDTLSKTFKGIEISCDLFDIFFFNSAVHKCMNLFMICHQAWFHRMFITVKSKFFFLFLRTIHIELVGFSKSGARMT